MEAFGGWLHLQSFALGLFLGGMATMVGVVFVEVVAPPMGPAGILAGGVLLGGVVTLGSALIGAKE
jgi:hypothetical protein